MTVIVGDETTSALRVGDLLPTSIYQGDALVWELPRTTLTVEGDTFEPMVELAEGSTATVSWVDENDDVVGTGLTPTITWDDEGPHTVRLLPSVPSDVVTLNLGFHSGQDNGLQSLPPTYHWPTQPVTAIANLQNLPGLRRFMAARTNGTSADPDLYTGPLLGGSLNFAGMTTLEYIECFMADVESVTLTGCTSMIRLCLEACQLTTLDLNPVRHNLRDLRAAFQQTGTLTLTALTGPMEQLYHFCTRRQVLTGMPDLADLPVIRQLWIWRCGVSLDTLTVRSTDDLHSIVLSSDDASGPNNAVRVLDLEGTDWGEMAGAGSAVRIRADQIGLEEIRLDGMTPIGEIRALGNNMSGAALDSLTTTIDGWGTSNGLLRIQSNTGRVGASGYAAVQNLIGRGWTVNYTSPTAATVTTTTLPALTEGLPINTALAATGDGTITWAVTAGTLPAGLTLDAAGSLTGTPTTPGAYDFTVTATNFVGSDAQQYTGTVAEPGETPLWEDTFERANATGFANSGGWFPGPGEADTDVAITDGRLVLTGTESYRRFLHDGGGSLPADIEVEIGFTIATATEPGDGQYWGICNRVNSANNTGCRVVFRNDKNTLRIGSVADASDPGTNISVGGALPSTWNDPGQHILTLRSVGTTHTVLADGVQIASRSFSTNSTLVGGAVGFVGEPQGRAWDYIRVFPAT